MWYVTTRTVSVVARIFEPQERKQLHSIVYGYTATQESFATSTTQALYVLGLISLSLAIINLFPFLPLDGGHVFWAVAEKVRGKRIPFEVMERAGVVGFVLILMIFVDRPHQRHLDAVRARARPPLGRSAAGGTVRTADTVTRPDSGR